MKINSVIYSRKVYPLVIKGKDFNSIVLFGPYGYQTFCFQNLDIKLNVDYACNKVNIITENYYKSKKNFSTYKTLLSNLSLDILNGFIAYFYLKGTGFRGFVKKNVLYLRLGYSHTVQFKIPGGIIIKPTADKFKKTTQFLIFGLNRQKVYETLTNIKRLKTVDNYKGKGIFEVSEVISLKERKKTNI